VPLLCVACYAQFVDYIDVVMARLLACVKDESRIVAQVCEGTQGHAGLARGALELRAES
jgi:hypothetical protein